MWNFGVGIACSAGNSDVPLQLMKFVIPQQVQLPEEYMESNQRHPKPKKYFSRS